MSAQPPFPASVRVGHRRFALAKWTKERADEAEEYGRTEPLEARISVWHGPNVAEVADTLLHEVLHAVMIDGGVRGGIELTEEWAATVAASGLTHVMQANPALREWLAWAWGQEP